MKKTIPMMSKNVLLCCLLWITGTATAQFKEYPEIYPSLPFDLNMAAENGFTKCTVWKGTYKKASGDEPGTMWSSPQVESHQYQRYIFNEGKMDMLSTYFPNGDKQWTMEFYYKQGLLSAIEKLKYDSLQESSLDFTYAYFYQSNGVPLQRVKMFGYPNKSVRMLEEFVFDSLNRVVRLKASAVGQSPYMDSLVGMQDKEKLMTLTEYTDSTLARRVYKNLYVILSDKKSFLNSEGKPAITEVRNSQGKILFTIDHKYEMGRASKNIHWVMREMAVPEQKKEEEDDKNKASKKKSPKSKNNKKKGDKKEIQVDVPMMVPIPEVYKVEYFTYNEEGLLETHIIEENGIQTVFEYTFFTE